jgi:hypothetical protein
VVSWLQNHVSADIKSLENLTDGVALLGLLRRISKRPVKVPHKAPKNRYIGLHNIIDSVADSLARDFAAAAPLLHPIYALTRASLVSTSLFPYCDPTAGTRRSRIVTSSLLLWRRWVHVSSTAAVPTLWTDARHKSWVHLVA